MTQMFDSFAEQRENPLKSATTAQSMSSLSLSHNTHSLSYTLFSRVRMKIRVFVNVCDVSLGTFERSTIHVMKDRCMEIEM